MAPKGIEPRLSSQAREVLARTLNPKRRFLWLDPSTQNHPLGWMAGAVPTGKTLCAIPFFGNEGRLNALLALGFGDSASTGARERLLAFQPALENLIKAMGFHRRITEFSRPARIETNCRFDDSAWGPAVWTDPGTLISIGVKPEHSSECPSDSDYCAVAVWRSGYVRLFVARPVSHGPARIWERLACDGAFQAACALGKSPSETVEWINAVWPVNENDAGIVRLVCCADVADSGREYVFAGSATHLLYESAPQTVAELYEHLRGPSQARGRWGGQRTRLRSGDFVILHTFDLSATLRDRHDVFRRLGVRLAHDGSRSVAEIVPQVVSLLRGGSNSPSSDPVLILLRAK